MLLVFERRILRRIYGKVLDAETGEWRIRHNYELLEISNMPPISSYIRTQRLRWAGHVARLEDGNLTKEVARGRPHSRRPPGRPKQRWEDNVKSDLRLLGVADPEQW